MNPLENTPRARHVVYEVQQRRHNKRRKKNSEPRQRNEQLPIPLEMAPLIQAAIHYGRKTHALGAIRATKMLTRVIDRLKTLEAEHPVLSSLIIEAEAESKEISGLFTVAYDESFETV